MVALTFAFLGFLPSCVLLLLVELSYVPPPGLKQPFAQCPVLPQFLHVLMSVARVGRAGRAISFLDLVFAFALPLAFPDRVDLRPVIIDARPTSS